MPYPWFNALAAPAFFSTLKMPCCACFSLCACCSLSAKCTFFNKFWRGWLLHTIWVSAQMSRFHISSLTTLAEAGIHHNLNLHAIILVLSSWHLSLWEITLFVNLLDVGLLYAVYLFILCTQTVCGSHGYPIDTCWINNWEEGKCNTKTPLSTSHITRDICRW